MFFITSLLHYAKVNKISRIHRNVTSMELRSTFLTTDDDPNGIDHPLLEFSLMGARGNSPFCYSCRWCYHQSLFVLCDEYLEGSYGLKTQFAENGWTYEHDRNRLRPLRMILYGRSSTGCAAVCGGILKMERMEGSRPLTKMEIFSTSV